MAAEAAKFGAVAVAAAAPGAVAMSVEAAEAVEAAEVVEAVDAEQAFGRLERLYAQLPAMEEKGAALARARSAAEVDGLAKAAAYRAAELARAEAEVARADARVCEAEAALARSEAAGGDAAEKAAHLGDLRLALMAAGTQRGLKVGPAQNAERALARALEASPFDTVEEARAALLPAESLAALSAEVQAYQADYAEALAVCQQLEDGEESEGLPQSATS
ncbi:hypothetical protein [Adlercreutzia equolifaciens]|uniref:hypothetical protein n=1 Tax=Adlercreutzia equolifaciens TaxID=446660 RepID=UPI00038987FA|nr:hypothetical protein [Adlercreutzia equolifaciens]RFT81328.1 hypothetical protein DX903_10465 [Adlercreutzia equolifaciens]BAN78071.1 conserved hypothetical protein [Adlercreutzia equolifaciens DSM 19450]